MEEECRIAEAATLCVTSGNQKWQQVVAYIYDVFQMSQTCSKAMRARNLAQVAAAALELASILTSVRKCEK